MSQQNVTTFNWQGLPNELMVAVLSKLDIRDVRKTSIINQRTYGASLPLLFQRVKLTSVEGLRAFLRDVPSDYYAYIRNLDISTEPKGVDYPEVVAVSGEIIALLSHCLQVERLSLRVGGSLSTDLIPIFSKFERLRSFTLANWADEEAFPLSERLAVSLIFAIPRLEELSLSRITRSWSHAAELVGVFPYVPIVSGDENIPPHPILGTELRLPAILRLPHLRKLKIRDTHLGDPQWSAENAPATSCPLELLDLGCSVFESPEFNQRCTERILRRVPSSIKFFSLSTSLSPGSATSAQDRPTIPAVALHVDTQVPPILPQLRTLHLTPLVPVSAIPVTLSQPQLANSPVHTLSCEFHPDDVTDGCAALESFLLQRVGVPRRTSISKKGSKAAESAAQSLFASSVKLMRSVSSGSRCHRPHTLYPELRTLSIELAMDDADMQFNQRSKAARRREQERSDAAKHLRELCVDLGVESVIKGIRVDDDQYPSAVTSKLQGNAVLSPPVVRGNGTRLRANTTA